MTSTGNIQDTPLFVLFQKSYTIKGTLSPKIFTFLMLLLNGQSFLLMNILIKIKDIVWRLFNYK